MPGRPSVPAALVLVAASVVAVVADHQARPQVETQHALLLRWAAAVSAHQPGVVDEPALGIAAWTAAQTRLVEVELGRLVGLIASGAWGRLQRDPLANVLGFADMAGINGLLQRGAVLHTDVAVIEASRDRIVSVRRPSTDTTFMLADGLHTGYGERSDHWPLARLLLEGVQPSPADDPLVRQFYLATSLYLANGLRFDELKPQLRSALQIFPNDPGLHLVAGAMHEFLAMPATQAGVRDGLQARGVRVDVETERAELALAVSHLRQATEVAPAFGEARLHFGRVLGLQGRHGDAADQLRRARPSLDVPMLAFYGEMFLGREEQALGRMDIAREHFERAASLFSRAQSPRLSLSQLAALRGDRAAAVAALGDTLTSVGADAGATDPWWVYNVSHTRDLTAELARLHRMVPRAVQK